MDQGPLFRRQFFVQPTLGVSATGGEVEYLRLQGHAANPGALLAATNLFLGPGGMLDVVSEAHGGEGLGHVSYTPGLRAALKRGSSTHTYRFQVPVTATRGTRFTVSCHGHDRLPAFSFTLEVGGS